MKTEECDLCCSCENMKMEYNGKKMVCECHVDSGCENYEKYKLRPITKKILTQGE